MASGSFTFTISGDITSDEGSRSMCSILSNDCMENVVMNTPTGGSGCSYDTESGYDSTGDGSADSTQYCFSCAAGTYNGDTISVTYTYDIPDSASGCDDPHICTFEGKHYELD
jgi:hypothetical protein